MKKVIIIFFILIIAMVVFLLVRDYSQKNVPAVLQNNQPAVQNNIPPDQNISNNINNNSSGFVSPLDRAMERVTKKPFGIYITPKTSPVQPERFRGFHTGTDFEIFPEELDADVPVSAVCSGKLLIKESASGYGGVAVESCELDGNPITIIYGHLKLASIIPKTGDSINAGEKIGILGKAYSAETDGERKHLHLGFHKGTGINIRGYVQSQSELSGWIDPCPYVCKN
jgi:murein DD-endopeptidase MepM/ murein hydrolase activator NlpD